MVEQKDRLGDKLRDAERAREDEYFERRDRELVDKLRSQQGADAAAQTIREIALLRCPKDGEVLESAKERGVNVEHCPKCRGVWLDKCELEEIAGTESTGWIARWLATK